MGSLSKTNQNTATPAPLTLRTSRACTAVLCVILLSTLSVSHNLLDLDAHGEVRYADRTQSWVWSGSKRVINFAWQSLQRTRENYFRNFGLSLRETIRQNVFLPSENTVSSTQNVEFYLRNLQITAFCFLMSYFMESKLRKISIDRCECCNN